MSHEQFVASWVGCVLAAFVYGWRASVRERAEPDDDEESDTDLAAPEPVVIESDPQ